MPLLRSLALLAVPVSLALATLAGAAAAPTAPDPAPPAIPPSSCAPPHSSLQSVADSETSDHLPGMVVVKLRADAPEEVWNTLPGADLWCTFAGGRTALMRVTPGQEREMASALMASPLVESAQPDFLRRLTVLPNDTRIGEQWALFKIKAPQAWDITTGNSSVVVAVLDSGVDLGHPDLKGKLVDGYDFANERALPQDDNGHGTHVAGIIAAAANNSIGTAGVSWGARVMPLKVTNSFGSTSDTVLANAIRFAADRGARVINMSLGGPEPSVILRDAVEYAAGKGALLVAAAGNCFARGDACGGQVNAPMYPAAYDKVIAVAATTFGDQHASYSQTGAYVKLAAPGGDPRTPSDPSSTMGILSTYWQPGGFGGYFALAGTSQAAPHVAGLAALLWSVSPAFTAAQVETFMESTAVDLGQPGRDPVFGFGRIDAMAAVSAAQAFAGAASEPTPTPPATPMPTPSATPSPMPSPSASPTPYPTPAAPASPTPTPVMVTFAVAAGGRAQFGNMTVTVPPNVTPDETQATLTVGNFSPRVTPPDGLVVGTSVEVTLRGASGNPITALAQPITLSARYTAAELAAAGGDPNGVIMGVWHDDSQTWTRLVVANNPVAQTVRATVDHLTKFSVLSVPFAVGLDTPAEGAVLADLAPELRWRLPVGATQYQVQIIPANQDGPGLNLIRNAESALDVPAPVTGQGNYIMLPGMGYTWRVRSTALAQPMGENTPGWGPWQSRSFRTPGPTSATITPVSPAPGALVADPRPSLTWANSNPAIYYYEVQLSKDRTFETHPMRGTAAIYWNLIHGGETTPLNTFTLPQGFALQPASAYFWRVRPRVQGDGAPVEWSPVWSFTTP
ncbi:MAG: S8 family peptidase [Chloroflexi bacterium]|nr:S8 family peptidase [Chloroflexota bacterium]